MSTSHRSSLGQKIKRARQAAGLSQKQLGQHLKLSDKTISAYEVNRALPSLPVLHGLSRVIKQPIHYFLENNVGGDLDLHTKLDRIAIELAEVKKLLNQRKSK